MYLTLSQYFLQFHAIIQEGSDSSQQWWVQALQEFMVRHPITNRRQEELHLLNLIWNFLNGPRTAIMGSFHAL